ncbi:MAG: Uma2 family endonuclease [Gemmataceae bacterium]
MSTAAAARPRFDTVADVLAAVGDVPPHRILWTPYPGTATEEDQLRLLDREPKRLVELIDGILVEKPMGHRESLFAHTLGLFVGNFVTPRNLGVVGTPDALMQFRNGRRLPDLSFTAWANLPSDDAHLQPCADFAPDLAVEILSADNSRREMAQKRRDYFGSGTQVVWEIDPDDRTVTVYTDPTTHTILTAADTLTGDPVLPGFVLPLADLFNAPQLNPRPARNP